jgi:hypothetical protein
MERVAEYYDVTGNAQAKAILQKWVSWAESVVTVNTATGAICEPGQLNWSGQPAESFTTGTSSTAQPPANPGLHVTVSNGCSGDIGVAASLAKAYMYYAAKSGDTTAETAAQNIIDVIHQFYGDSLGFSAPETRTDYKNFTSAFNTTNFEGLFIPSGWTGSYPGLGSTQMTSADNTFLSIRPWYTSVANYPEVQNYLNGGAAPVFNYHRFWAEADIATAFDSFAFLFPNVSPPASATPTVTVTNPGTQTGTVGTAISGLQVQASDSATGKTLTYSATDLPFGLTLNSSTGAITGTPTMAGTYLTTLTVNDGSGASSVNLSWTISQTGNVITVTNPGNQTSTSGTAITALQIQATDSAAGQTLSYSAANLPTGLSISSSTGQITGTPTTTTGSPFSVVVTVTDPTGAKGTAAFTWTIKPPGTNIITITQPANQTSTVGTAITGLQIQATDSAAGQTLTYSAGTTLPPGLSISSSTGLITGTPTSATGSPFSVTVTVTDATAATSSVTFSWTVNPQGNIVTVTNPGNQTGTVGTAITSLQIKATDSAAGQTLTYSAALPAGLSIGSTTGLITGTPTTAGTSTVTVTVTDTTGAKGTTNFTWVINPKVGLACHVTYTLNSAWNASPNGFTSQVTIANTGTTAITSWSLTFTWPGDEVITANFNGGFSQTGANATLTNASYNGNIAPGANITDGFQGTWTSNHANPTTFAVNGTTCT